MSMPIEKTITAWHKILAAADIGALAELLADDVVFFSPVVFKPQPGKALTQMYLAAAMQVLAATERGADGTEQRAFHYTREVLQGMDAVLEFETMVDGKIINGVDMIRCNEAGKIVEFKVMIRPLQAINLLHQKMAAMLQQLDSNSNQR